MTLGELLEDVTETEGLVTHLPEEIASPLRQHWLTPVTIRPIEIDPDAKKALDKLTANEILHDSNIRQAGEVGTYEKEESRQAIILDWLVKIGFGMGVWEILRNYVVGSGL